MFVTTRTVTETTPTGDVVAHPQGAQLDTFPAWNNAVKAALLRMGYVREVADAPLGAESASAMPAPAPVDAPKATLLVAPAAKPAMDAGPACPHCPGKIFANTQGLRLHMTRMHAKAVPEAAQLP